MLSRELEPELMDSPEEAQSYNDMDHQEVNRRFVADLLAAGPVGERVIDLGTGTALIPIELCRQEPNCRVMASDAAVSMLELARLNIALEGFEHRIELHHGDSKHLEFESDSCDSVISNSLIHHLPDCATAIEHMIRIAKPGGRIFVRDLMRPATREEVEQLVETYAADETDECQQMFRQSLIAALTLDEIRQLVSQFGFAPNTVNATSDRHWTWNCTKPQPD